jgi:hypothetical protein
MVSLRITAFGQMQISLSVPRDIKKLTRSDQGNENCDDHEEYRNVFDNLWGLSIPGEDFGSIPILTMARRFFLSLMLKMGACICFDGRNQTSGE